MPGPPPKHPSQRQRRNVRSTAARLEALPATRVPLPPVREWEPTTLAWWTTIWDSPMVDEWVDADVPGLMALAVLVDEFWMTGDSKIHAEIRMASREFGLSPLSRRTLQWEVAKVESAERRVTTPRRRSNGPTVLSALQGGKSA